MTQKNESTTPASSLGWILGVVLGTYTFFRVISVWPEQPGNVPEGIWMMLGLFLSCVAAVLVHSILYFSSIEISRKLARGNRPLKRQRIPAAIIIGLIIFFYSYFVFEHHPALVVAYLTFLTLYWGLKFILRIDASVIQDHGPEEARSRAAKIAWASLIIGFIVFWLLGEPANL